MREACVCHICTVDGQFLEICHSAQLIGLYIRYLRPIQFDDFDSVKDLDFAQTILAHEFPQPFRAASMTSTDRSDSRRIIVGLSTLR